MQRISRATDTIWRTGQSEDDEPFTDDQFAQIYNLYHEGHKLGTHHREVHDWLGESDPLSAVEEARIHAQEANLNQIAVSALANKMEAPDHVRYALPAWHGKGYNDGRGGTTHYDGLRPFSGGWRYDPPTREDPMRRNGPW